MTRDEAQGAFVRLLLEKVRQDRYPSWTQMELIEESIPPAMIPDYLAVLAEKVARDTVPSIPMLRRIQRVAQRLPREEQQRD